MTVGTLMTREVQSCGPDDTLERAAQIMWEHDCGCVPVVDSGRHVLAVVTDRDVCMAAYLRGVPLRQERVAAAMSRQLHTARAADPIEVAERLMWERQVRRLPVTDDAGRLVGMLSLGDIARRARIDPGAESGTRPEAVARTLAGVSSPPPAGGE